MGSELEQEVDTIETSVGTSDDEASSSGSLWARIKYALANMVATSGAQTIADVKTFLSSPVVPTTPGTTTSAVNQAYVESTVDGVNNIVHKSGNETIAGIKTFETYLTSPVAPRFGSKIASQLVSGVTEWHKAYEYEYTGSTSYADVSCVLLVTSLRRSAGISASDNAIGILTVAYRSSGSLFNWMVAGDDIDPSNFKLSRKYDSTTDKTTVIIWCKTDDNCNKYGFIKMMGNTLLGFVDNWKESTDTDAYSEPTTEGYDSVKASTIMSLRS